MLLGQHRLEIECITLCFFYGKIPNINLKVPLIRSSTEKFPILAWKTHSYGKQFHCCAKGYMMSYDDNSICLEVAVTEWSKFSPYLLNHIYGNHLISQYKLTSLSFAKFDVFYSLDFGYPSLNSKFLP